eukprot:NODE_3771_length_853_cov_87.410468_g3748_i0.p1 GENE.NODE_3771_length_853_cov_87.410468_g3748_i0~~NODE_3771_length_853_cov_87.410468_g3748_i0.p1  ORF type:complete len:224 (-),score=64.44 NODE_3771_length_853_cov_87.410468_g3748_i0:130-801(-)
MLRVVLLAVAVATAFGACPDTLNAAGMSSNYNETVAHAIHAMTVQAMRMFNPEARVENHIPTVNRNIAQPGAAKVTSYAPDVQLPTDFATPVMQQIDDILSSIGSPTDGLGSNWSPVERIAHQFHMNDLWSRILSSAYPKVLENTPSADTCYCLTQTADNGILAAVEWIAQHYESGTPITLLNRPIPKLVDADSWGVWKARLLHYYSDADLFDAAMYIYCATL